MTDKRLADVSKHAAAPRRAWTAPRVVTMSAGAAENGAGQRGDNQVNYS